MRPTLSAPSAERSLRNREVIGGIAALPIGVLSGFTGVGGGEYRAPVLLSLLRDIRGTIAANLLAGTIVSAVTVGLRGGIALSADLVALAALMISTGILGAYCGAVLAAWSSTRTLKILLAGILFATALRLLFFEIPSPASFALGPSEVVLALPVGFALGVVSGLLGVAGGEYRIPALIFLFGVPAVVAGTVSSLVALPLQAVGFWKHHRLRVTKRETLRIAAAMAVTASAGVAVGVFLLGRTSDILVTRVLGAAMIAAAARIAWDIRTPSSETARAAGR